MTATLPFTTSHTEWIALVVGVVSLIGIGGVVSMLFCHQSGCWRRGRFAHGHYRLCHVHHPLVPSDGKVTAEHVAGVRNLERQHQTDLLEELHYFTHHGVVHPRVSKRLDHGEGRTPTLGGSKQ